MKKAVVSALTTALVVGAFSTTFASTNPFSDVPSDHWAIDAVEQLAQDGVIEGYGDTTFRGDQHITRYEMAQMIAKAMAKKDVNAADKATLDKLAAEFADELNNLGVRVSNLEKHADNVKWTGVGRYDYKSVRPDKQKHVNTNEALFRLEPSAEVNNNWSANARLEATQDLKEDSAGSDVSLKRIWAQGDYHNWQAKLGKFGSTVNNTMILDDEISGAALKFKSGDVSAQVEAGRLSDDNLTSSLVGGFGTTNYQGVALGYDKDGLGVKATYQNFDLGKDDDHKGIWSVGAKYAFDKNVSVSGEYAKSNVDVPAAVEKASRDDLKKAYDLTALYKGATAEDKNSWGAYVSYRYLGDAVSLDPTYDSIQSGLKGWQLGAQYTLLKNVVGTAEYGQNKDLKTGNDVKTLFGRVEFTF